VKNVEKNESQFEGAGSSGKQGGAVPGQPPVGPQQQGEVQPPPVPVPDSLAR